jgi:RimJ/RimL family protein N-acetyltransferase
VTVFVAAGGLALRLPVDADEALQARLHSPEVAGEFNSFDDLAEDRATRPPPGVHRAIAVLDDGTPVGALSWFQVPYGPNAASAAWNIGITVLPEYRGRGYGSLAQRLLARHLFATTPANRVEAGTDIENIAEQRALERAGFYREAVLRQAQWRNRAWHDLVLYSMLRSDRP